MCPFCRLVQSCYSLEAKIRWRQNKVQLPPWIKQSAHSFLLPLSISVSRKNEKWCDFSFHKAQTSWKHYILTFLNVCKVSGFRKRTLVERLPSITTTALSSETMCHQRTIFQVVEEAIFDFRRSIGGRHILIDNYAKVSS